MNPSALVLGIPLAVAVSLLLLPKPAHAPLHPQQRRTKATVLVAPRFTETKPLKGAIPEKVAELAGKWGEIFGVPRAWVRSQAYAESKNVPSAINEGTGAAGIMQILPDTAAWLIRSLKKSKFYTSVVKETLGRHVKGYNLLDPDLNVLLATYYLALLKRKFGDDHDVVAAAYNIGPNRIAYHLRKKLPLPTKSRIYLAMVKDARARGFV